MSHLGKSLRTWFDALIGHPIDTATSPVTPTHPAIETIADSVKPVLENLLDAGLIALTEKVTGLNDPAIKNTISNVVSNVVNTTESEVFK